MHGIQGGSILQEQRREQDPATAEAVDGFLVKLDTCLAAEMDFTVVVDDPAGRLCLSSLLCSKKCIALRIACGLAAKQSGGPNSRHAASSHAFQRKKI